MKFTFFNKYLNYFFAGLLVSTLLVLSSCEEEDTPTEPDKTENITSANTDTEKKGPTASELADAQKVLELVNEERTSRGLKPLKLNDALNAAAFKHSKDMKDNIGDLDHTGSDESSFDQRIKREQYAGFARAENIALGQRTAQQVHNAWMSSPGHKGNILLADVTEMGLGRDGNYWTQVFGRN